MESKESGRMKGSPNHQPAPSHHPILRSHDSDRNWHLTFFLLIGCMHCKEKKSFQNMHMFSLCMHIYISLCGHSPTFSACHWAIGFNSCAVRPEKPEYAKIKEKSWHFSLLLPLPLIEQPSINGFQLLEAVDGVMVAVLYGPLVSRCLSAALWGPE